MYDLFVLTLNQKRHSCLHSNKICVKALNKNGRKRQKYYYKIWPFINNSHGILYKLFTKEKLGEYECCDEMFEFNAVNNLEYSSYKFASNIADDCIEDWVSIKLNEDYKEGFVALFDLLLSCSPMSTIAFLCRGQSTDKEVILGLISRNDFLEMLCLGSVKTNICYLVGG